MRVLIVEDDDAIRQLLGRILQREGAEVASVPGALAAIELLERETFDLLLLDLMMPVHSGFEVIEFLRLHPGRARTAVVISAADDELLSRVNAEVIHGVLRKPFEIANLIELVRGIQQALSTELREGERTASASMPIVQSNSRITRDH